MTYNGKLRQRINRNTHDTKTNMCTQNKGHTPGTSKENSVVDGQQGSYMALLLLQKDMLFFSREIFCCLLKILHLS